MERLGDVARETARLSRAWYAAPIAGFLEASAESVIGLLLTNSQFASKAAAAGTIRGDFGDKEGDAKMRNVCHASDSPEAAADEIKRFFKDCEIF